MQSLMPASNPPVSQRSSLFPAVDSSSPLPAAKSGTSFRPVNLTASGSFMPMHGISSAGAVSGKPSGLTSSSSFQPSQPSLTSSMTFKTSSMPSAAAPSEANGLISSLPAASTAATGYKPAGTATHLQLGSYSSGAAGRKSPFGPRVLRLSSQIPGGGPSQLGQRFGTAISLNANASAARHQPLPGGAVQS